MRNGGSDNSLNGRSNGQGSRDEECVRALVDQMVVALRAGDSQKAAHLLIAAQAAGRLTERAAILPQLTQDAGSGPVSEFLTHLAAFPCFYCRSGFHVCELCEGRGRLSDDMPCERCAGLGVARCDFCGGSGWASLDALPGSVRPLVTLQRVRLALRSARRMLAQIPPAAPASAQSEPQKRAARQVLAVERQRAILEEALFTAARAGINSRIGRELGKLLPECAACVPGVERRLGECLGDLARTTRLKLGEHASDSSVQQRVRRRADYYDALRSSEEFAGSSFERPHLREALRQALQQPQDSPGSANANRDGGGA
jgi:hypothetical protein